MVTKTLDPVADRLVSAGGEHASGLLDWVDAQQHRQAMRRRAAWCSVIAFAMILLASLVASVVTILLAGQIRQLFDELSGQVMTPWSVTIMPWMLGLLSMVLVIGGILAWSLDSIPGLRSIRSAIDLSTAADAMTRLLSVGCTYPDAYRAAAAMTRSRRSREWLVEAAQRVERGGEDVNINPSQTGDLAIVELLIDASDGQPERQWGIAAEHFFDVAQRRLVLLLTTAPVLSTIVAGLLVWAAISTSLGWIWLGLTDLIGALA